MDTERNLARKRAELERLQVSTEDTTREQQKLRTEIRKLERELVNTKESIATFAAVTGASFQEMQDDVLTVLGSMEEKFPGLKEEVVELAETFGISALETAEAMDEIGIGLANAVDAGELFADFLIATTAALVDAFIPVITSDLAIAIMNLGRHALGPLLDDLSSTEYSFSRLMQPMANATQAFQQQNRYIDISVATAGVYLQRLRDMEEELRYLEEQGLDTTAVQKAFAETLEVLKEKFPGLRDNVEGCTEAIAEYIRAWEEETRTAAQEDKRLAMIQGREHAYGTLISATEKLECATRREAEAYKAARDAANGLSGNQLQTQVALGTLRGEVENFVGAQENATEALIAYDRMLTILDGSLSPAVSAMDTMTSATGELEEGFDSLTEAMKTLSESGEEAIQDLETAMLSAAESFDGQAIGETLADTIIDGFTSADFSQLPQEVQSAITAGEGEVIAAMQSVADGLQGLFDEMAQAAGETSNEMMDNIEAAITGKTESVQTAVENLKTAIMETLSPHLSEESQTAVEASLRAMMSAVSEMKSDVTASFRGLGDSMMDGLGQAITDAMPGLRAKAQAIADEIRRTIA
ncbi:MAG: hypothetical protein FWD84_07565, partial [Oscillospiraceae bacterium]|nr:hypothetical protein [Oscillospiraceae bacterium]